MSLANKFNENWEPITETGCWLWTGRVNGASQRGYLSYGGKQWHAPRLSWEIHNGPIPLRLQVCHHCDIPACVNPRHLFLGTQKDNIQDCIKKGRFPPRVGWGLKTHCKNGHPWDNANTRMALGSYGTMRRNCRVCDRTRHAAVRARNKRGSTP